MNAVPEKTVPRRHRRHHSVPEKISAGLRYAFFDLWSELAGWFFFGLLVSALITSLVPDGALGSAFGGGVDTMFMMVAASIPFYICASASTPIAASLILKGVSPGAALVFLLAGPATNITSLTVLLGLLGKRTTAIYLTVIAGGAVVGGLALDWIYLTAGISAQAVVGRAGDLIPFGIKTASALVLLAFSIKPVAAASRRRLLWLRRHLPLRRPPAERLSSSLLSDKPAAESSFQPTKSESCPACQNSEEKNCPF